MSVSQPNAEAVPPDDVADGPVTIVLSPAAWDQFVDHITNPPPPNDALRALMAEFGPWTDRAAEPPASG